ncbi:MAG: DMT family transporter [Woeseiaceae bacterium]|nr:DMT family transporter [Woeseiaceae bacterium]
MPHRPTPANWASLLVLTVLWGSAFMFNELALMSFSPAVLVTGRIVLAVACLLLMMRLTGVRLPTFGRGWFYLAAMAVLGTVLPFSLTAWAQQHIDSAVAGVLMAAMPLFVLTLAHFFVPGSRITAPRATGFVLGFCGVALLIGPDALRGLSGNTTLLGSLAVLAAALCYAVNTVLARRVAVSNPIGLAAGTMIVASVISLPSAIAGLPSTVVPPSGLAVIALLFLGLLSTGLATVMYFRLIQGPGPAFVSLVNYLVPGWAVIAGALVLGETLSVHVFLGLALILTGLAISEFSDKLRSVLVHARASRSQRLAREDA